jgi:hypothetical protein
VGGGGERDIPLISSATYTMSSGEEESAVGELRKTRHPRNAELNKVLKVCFSGAVNSRFSGACNL